MERRIAVSERQRAADHRHEMASGSSDDFGLESEPSPRSVRLWVTHIMVSPYTCPGGIRQHSGAAL